MKKSLAILLAIISFASTTQAKTEVRKYSAPWRGDGIAPERVSTSKPPAIQTFVPSDPISPNVTIPGSIGMGMPSWYHYQVTNSAVHNIAVDPNNAQRIHAIIVAAPTATPADTVTKPFFPQVKVYYLTSADGGASWSSPKPISDGRNSYGSLALMKRGSEYVPVIAANKNFKGATIDSICPALYIEQGAIGEGNFAEFLTVNKTYLGEHRNITSPSIAVSNDGMKIYMAAGVSRPLATDPFYYIQFSIFSLSEDQKSAVWGGWKRGPCAPSDIQENPQGLSQNGLIGVHVSQGGKLGITWIARDYVLPDLGLYLAETTDEGETWPITPTQIMVPIETDYTSDGDEYYMCPFYYDFWYANESPCAVIAGFYYNMQFGGTGAFVPSSGALLFWRDDWIEPKLIYFNSSAANIGTMPIGDPMYSADELGQWNTSLGIDPLGAVIDFPNVARAGDGNTFSVYFHAWQEGDVEDVGNIPGDQGFTKYPYGAIYRTSSRNGGADFTRPEKIFGNDPLNGEEAKYDYRHVISAANNDGVTDGYHANTMFFADSTAGYCVYEGAPGFVEGTWHFEQETIMSVENATNRNELHVTLHPNPISDKAVFEAVNSDMQSFTIELTDLLGRVVIRESFTGKKATLDCRGLKAGSYRYQAQTASHSPVIGTLVVVR